MIRYCSLYGCASGRAAAHAAPAGAGHRGSFYAVASGHEPHTECCSVCSRQSTTAALLSPVRTKSRLAPAPQPQSHSACTQGRRQKGKQQERGCSRLYCSNREAPPATETRFIQPGQHAQRCSTAQGHPKQEMRRTIAEACAWRSVHGTADLYVLSSVPGLSSRRAVSEPVREMHTTPWLRSSVCGGGDDQRQHFIA